MTYGFWNGHDLTTVCRRRFLRVLRLRHVAQRREQAAVGVLTHRVLRRKWVRRQPHEDGRITPPTATKEWDRGSGKERLKTLALTPGTGYMGKTGYSWTKPSFGHDVVWVSPSTRPPGWVVNEMNLVVRCRGRLYFVNKERNCCCTILFKLHTQYMVYINCACWPWYSASCS